MPDVRNDRRVIKTKQQIREALIELLAEKSENNISVRELAQRAGINRGTFYIHYKDIHDLVEQLVEEAVEQLRGVCHRHPPAACTGQYRPCPCHACTGAAAAA